MQNTPNLNTVGVGWRTASTTTSSVIAEIIAPTAKGVYVDKIDVYATDTTGSIVTVGFPAAKGGNPTTPRAFQVINPISNPAFTPKTTIARAWSTTPTAPSVGIAQAQLPPTIGGKVAFEFPGGLLVPAGLTLVLYSNSTTGIVDFTVIGRES